MKFFNAYQYMVGTKETTFSTPYTVVKTKHRGKIFFLVPDIVGYGGEDGYIIKPMTEKQFKDEFSFVPLNSYAHQPNTMPVAGR